MLVTFCRDDVAGGRSRTGHYACVSVDGKAGSGIDWSMASRRSLPVAGFDSLAVDPSLRSQLTKAAHHAPPPLPKTGGDDHVRFGGLSARGRSPTQRPPCKRSRSLTDGINGAVTSTPGSVFNHAVWALRRPTVSASSRLTDPPTAAGVIAITTLGSRRVSGFGTATEPTWHLRNIETARHISETADGDLVMLRCEAWPSAEALSPVHEAGHPVLVNANAHAATQRERLRHGLLRLMPELPRMRMTGQRGLSDGLRPC